MPRLPWPALALLGAALTLLAALITVSAPGAGPPPGPGAVVALADGDAIAWTFTAERGGLSGMRVWLARPAPAGAALALTIADAELPGLPLVRAAAPLRAAGPDGAVNLAFSPLRVAASPQAPTAT
ncbi:MAG TPA: hypothetical protein PKD53_09110, partial [Chloroflexaceae bacterium]|nr:hypothetical protein [Chloroflexaceae bacterium]